MRKVTPSQKMRKEIEAILEGTPEEFNGHGILEEIIRKGAALVLYISNSRLCWSLMMWSLFLQKIGYLISA